MAAGTIVDRTRTPLTVWFTACWLFATGTDGIAALRLTRTLEIGSDQTAWALRHRLRSVLVRPDRDRLAGLVETHLHLDKSRLGRAYGELSDPRLRNRILATLADCFDIEYT